MQGNEFIEVETNVRLHIRDWGQGKTIVFIPGWPLSHEMYEYQFTQLPKQGYRCVGITLRGFGKSSQPWGEYTYDVFADDENKVPEALDLRDLVLIGHSTGGGEVVRYAAQHGVKAAAREFATTPKTVRKWLRRWTPGSKQGLAELSRAPKHPARRTNSRRTAAGATPTVTACSRRIITRDWHGNTPSRPTGPPTRRADTARTAPTTQRLRPTLPPPAHSWEGTRTRAG